MRRFGGSILLVAAVLAPAGRAADITTDGHKLTKALDALEVEKLWLPGKVVDFDTGKAKRDAKDGRRVTHCSAFVAVACGKFGAPMLRPPEHSAKMLANAQADWLSREGKEKGWKPVATPVRAQHFANEGRLVVAAYREPGDAKPGHIAIVRPSTKPAAKIGEEGPQVIQAGATNANSTSLMKGFRHHKGAFPDGVRYYVHEVVWK